MSGIVGIILVLVLVGFGLYLVRLIPMDATIARIITAVVILFTVLWVLQHFGFLSGVGLRVR